MAMEPPPWRQRLDGLGFNIVDKGALIRLLLPMTPADRELAVDTDAQMAHEILRGMLSDAAGEHCVSMAGWQNCSNLLGSRKTNSLSLPTCTAGCRRAKLPGTGS